MNIHVYFRYEEVSYQQQPSSGTNIVFAKNCEKLNEYENFSEEGAGAPNLDTGLPPWTSNYFLAKRQLCEIEKNENGFCACFCHRHL